MEIAGHLDLCGPTLIEGWLYLEAWQDKPIGLQVYVGNQLIGECATGRFRKDLQDAGYGDGKCGFSFAVPPEFGLTTFVDTKLRLLGSPLYLLPSDHSVIANSVAPDAAGMPADVVAPAATEAHEVSAPAELADDAAKAVRKEAAPKIPVRQR